MERTERMKPELDESLIHSAYLDSDGSLYLYDKDEKDLEGWPKSWPEHIPCVQTFLRARDINYVNPSAPPTLAELYGSKPFTPPQPAHGEPWEKPDRDVDDYGNARWLAGETGSFRDEDEALRATACWNFLAPHPDLSVVEVHSKETMDEVRASLQAAEKQLRGYEVQIDGEWGCCRGDEEMEQEKLWGGAIYAARSALAKLNPPQL